MSPVPPVSTALVPLMTLLFTEPGIHKSYPRADMALLSTLAWSVRGFGAPPVGYYPTLRVPLTPEDMPIEITHFHPN